MLVGQILAEQRQAIAAVLRFQRDPAVEEAIARLGGVRIAIAEENLRPIGERQIGAAAQVVADIGAIVGVERIGPFRSEEHTSELQSLMRNSYAVFCLKKKTKYTHR